MAPGQSWGGYGGFALTRSALVQPLSILLWSSVNTLLYTTCRTHVPSVLVLDSILDSPAQFFAPVLFQHVPQSAQRPPLRPGRLRRALRATLPNLQHVLVPCSAVLGYHSTVCTNEPGQPPTISPLYVPKFPFDLIPLAFHFRGAWSASSSPPAISTVRSMHCESRVESSQVPSSKPSVIEPVLR